MRLTRFGLFVLLLSLTASLFLNVVYLYANSERYEVVRVIDGDSFDLKEGRRVRLLSIDAPEKNRCLYSEARERLTELILNKKVRLQDVETDDYGRTLANVYVEDFFVNKAMLIEGLARFTYASSPHYDELKSINKDSKDLHLGIYSSLCRTISPADNCQIKANNNHGKKFYFTNSCQNYEQVIIDESFGDKWFCSEEEAMNAGFIKATNCN